MLFRPCQLLWSCGNEAIRHFSQRRSLGAINGHTFDTVPLSAQGLIAEGIAWQVSAQPGGGNVGCKGWLPARGAVLQHQRCGEQQRRQWRLHWRQRSRHMV